MAEVVTIEVNCPDLASAQAMAGELLRRRLVACANVHGGVASLYWWRGKIERAAEVPLMLKTRAELFPAVAAAVRSLHPYEVPAIVAHPVAEADPAYAAWVRAETEAAGSV